MLTDLLRRLQGRSAPRARAAGGPVRVQDADGPAADADPPGIVLDGAALETLYLEWALGLAPDESHEPGAADAAFAHMQVVAHRFDARRMPRLPALLPQLLAAMRRDDTDAAGLAALVGRDPTLAGEVLRVANSAFYRRAHAPAGLQQAIQLIGDEGLRHVVLASVMRPILRGDATHPGFAAAERLWAHAEACAWLGGRLAAGRCDVGEAQLAGILTGTGVAALSRMISPSLLADAAGAPDFAERFLRIARPLSERAGAHWHLPPPVLDALKAAEPTHSDDLPTVLRAADRLAMGHLLVRAGRIPATAGWRTGLDGFDTPAGRASVIAALSAELDAVAGAHEPALADG